MDLFPVSGRPLDAASMLLPKKPLGEMPAPDRAEGQTPFDSRVICTLLDKRPRAGLYSDGACHWEMLTLEALADGSLDAALLMTCEARLRP